MRVLHVTDGYLPRVGGIELHVRDLATRQRLSGLDAQVLTLTPSVEDLDPDWVHRVRGLRVDEPAGLRRAAAQLDRHFTSNLSAGADVVHVHVSVFSPFGAMAARMAAGRGLAVLVTVHSMWTRLGPGPVMARDLLGLRRWPVVWSSVSARAAAPVRDLLGADIEVHVLPNAVEPDRWRSADATWAEIRPAGAPLTVVSVMRLTHVKRTLPLARILCDVRRSLPADIDMRAVVVGDGPRRPAMERHLHRHGLRDLVTLAGRIDRDAIREELHRAAVFLAPAEKESFGIAPLEARTTGLPVVASSQAGVSEFVTHGVHGFLGDTDAAMARHVTRLLTDDSLRVRIARHNRQVAPQHDWDHALAGADRLYASALRRERATR